MRHQRLTPTVPLIASVLLLVPLDSATDRRVIGSEPPPTSAPQTTSRTTSRPATPHWPFVFEPNVGQAADHWQFVARAPQYTLGLAGTRMGVRVIESTQRQAELGISFRNTAGPQAIAAEDRQDSVSNYFVGRDASEWRTAVPHFARVRYTELYPKVDAVFYGNEQQLEYDLVVAPGGDPTQITLTLDGVTDAQLNEAGDLRLDVDGVPFVQRRPVAYQLDASGERVVVEASYRLHADRTIDFVLGEYDHSTTLVIDPVLVYSTYLGGTGDEFPLGGLSFANPAAIDATGALVVAGSTASTNFPSAGTAPAGTNAFVAKFNPTGSALQFATYLGGSANEDRASVAIDAAGAIYVAGNTASANFPVTSGVFDTSFGGVQDAFVAKLSSSGTLVYATYLGGSNDESAEGIAVNAAGQAVVVGGTLSTNYPVANAYQATKNTNYDAFVTVVNATATAPLLFSTYLGGDGIDSAYGVAVDTTGALHIAGQTASSDFPIVAPLQASRVGTVDIFVTKFPAGGGTPTYSTYLGGTETAGENAKVAVDTDGNTYLAGFTDSANFPAGAATPAQPAKAAGLDAFVAKLNSSGSSLLYRTFLGGAGEDFALGLDIDVYGNAYVTGSTTSSDFPRVQAWDTTLGGAQDGFVTKLSPTGSAFKYSSYLGGAAGVDSGIGIAVDAIGYAFVAGWTASNNFPTASPAGSSVFDSTLGGATDAFATKVGFEDDDNDGLPDDWEEDNGLDPGDGTGNNGCNGDPDNDGSTNCGEFGGNTNPTSALVRYFAEGATSSFFDDQFALANTSATQTATVVMRFRTSAGGAPIQHTLSIGPTTRVSVNPKTVDAGLQNAEFSTEIRSNITVVSDRTMRWGDTGYGSHAETSIGAPASTWYLAEGATIGGFSLFYLIQNPNNVAANVTVRYLLSGGAAPIVRNYSVAANSRFNIWVNTVPGLAAAEVSGVLTTDPSTPIIVERAMYLNSQGQLFGAGHNSAGVNAPALNWFLAEGATGPYFDLFLLVANPNSTTATVQASYLLASGQNVVRTYQVPANSRFNIWVDTEPGLSNVEVSTTLTSTNGVPIIVERAMWWPLDYTQWFEAHNSPGTTQTGVTWALAEGEVGGTVENDTFVLIANTSNFAASVRVTLLFEDGTTSTRTYPVAANRRFNVWVRSDFAQAIGTGRRFGVLVESLGGTPAQLVVERAQYSNAAGVTWAAGTNALATRLQ